MEIPETLIQWCPSSKSLIICKYRTSTADTVQVISGLAQAYYQHQGFRGGGLTNWVKDIQDFFLFVNMRNICSNAIFSLEIAIFVPKVPICFRTWIERCLQIQDFFRGHFRFEQMIWNV